MKNKRNVVISKKVLFLATVDVHIYYFHIPFMKLLKNMGYEVEVAAAPIGFKEKIKKEGFKVYSIPFSRNPLSFQNIRAFFIILNLMKKRKYIMVHTHTPVASFLGRIAGKLVHIPLIIYTAHGFHFHEYGCKIKNFIYYQLEKVAGRFTDVLITINEDDYRIAKENNILPNGRVIYIKGVGVNSEKFALKRIKEDRRHEILTKLSIDSEMFVISSTGRLAREKHFDQVIESLGYVNEKRLKFKFLIAGDGPLYYNLLETAKFYGIQDEVMFLGQIDQIPELLSISNIYVTTSSREGLPVSVMEAMAMEKPVIAYNIRGVRDLIKDGVNGFLVPFGDIEGFANKIIYLMENQEIAKEMGKRGREKIEKEFSLKVILKDMKKLYREILKEE